MKSKYSFLDLTHAVLKKEVINIVKSWLKYLLVTNAAEVNVMNFDACYQEQQSSQQQSSRRKTKNNNQKRDSFESLPLFTELKQLKIPKHF